MDTSPQVLHVESVLEERSLQLELLAGGEGLSRRVRVPDVQKPGLALAGHVEALHPERIQVLGFSEMSYLGTLDQHLALLRFQALSVAELPCVIVTRALDVPEALVEICRERALPLLRTSLDSATFLAQLKPFLAGRLNPTMTTHGVLVDVYGVGILLLGKSGIGKSEMALDLVLRGHRLVADDIVEVQRRSSKVLVGHGPEIIKHHMEIRGLGILNIKDLFGIASVRDAKRVDLVVELVEWNEDEEYDRLGVDDETYIALEVEIPMIRLPVRQGRNMTSIIEVAARNQLLKVRGHHSARQFQDRLVRAIADNRSMLTQADLEEE